MFWVVFVVGISIPTFFTFQTHFSQNVVFCSPAQKYLNKVEWRELDIFQRAYRIWFKDSAIKYSSDLWNCLWIINEEIKLANIEFSLFRLLLKARRFYFIYFEVTITARALLWTILGVFSSLVINHQSYNFYKSFDQKNMRKSQE